MRSPMRTSANEELGTLAENNPLTFFQHLIFSEWCTRWLRCETSASPCIVRQEAQMEARFTEDGWHRGHFSRPSLDVELQIGT